MEHFCLVEWRILEPKGPPFRCRLVLRMFCEVARVFVLCFIMYGIIVTGVTAASASADEASLAKVQIAIRSFKEQHGYPMNDQDFLTAATATGVKLQKQEMGVAWGEVVGMQSPSISSQDLADLLKFKRESIQDIQLDYVLREETLGQGRHKEWLEQRRKVMFAGSKALVQVNTDSKEGPSPEQPLSILKSYDGEVVRTITTDTSNKQPVAAINNLQSRQDFFQTHNILVASMLIDARREWNAPHGFYDLVYLLTDLKAAVLERTERIADTDCLVVTDGLCRVFLDSARDFSVIRVEEFEIKYDASDILLGRVPTAIRELMQLEDYGNGIWLPSTVDRVLLKDGKPALREVSSLVDLKINQGIDDSVFRDVIPEGMLVFDGVRKASYRFGNAPSIEGMLGETAVRKAKVKAWLVWLNVVAIFILVTVIAFRRRRRNTGMP